MKNFNSFLLTCPRPSIYVPKMMGGVESIVFPITSLTSHLSPDGADAGERKSPSCSGQHVVGSGQLAPHTIYHLLGGGIRLLTAYGLKTLRSLSGSKPL